MDQGASNGSGSIRRSDGWYTWWIRKQAIDLGAIEVVAITTFYIQKQIVQYDSISNLLNTFHFITVMKIMQEVKEELTMEQKRVGIVVMLLRWFNLHLSIFIRYFLFNDNHAGVVVTKLLHIWSWLYLCIVDK